MISEVVEEFYFGSNIIYFVFRHTLQVHLILTKVIDYSAMQFITLQRSVDVFREKMSNMESRIDPLGIPYLIKPWNLTVPH